MIQNYLKHLPNSGEWKKVIESADSGKIQFPSATMLQNLWKKYGEDSKNYKVATIMVPLNELNKVLEFNDSFIEGILPEIEKEFLLKKEAKNIKKKSKTQNDLIVHSDVEDNENISMDLDLNS